MAVLYREIVFGATAYPGSSGGSAVGPTAVGANIGATAAQVQSPGSFEPQFHAYRVVSGTSGADCFVSWDGVSDAARIPFDTSGSGAILPLIMPVSYKTVWVRSAAGVTGTVGIGLYTRQ